MTIHGGGSISWFGLNRQPVPPGGLPGGKTSCYCSHAPCGNNGASCYSWLMVSVTAIFRIRLDGVWTAARIAAKTNTKIIRMDLTGRVQVK